MTLQTFNEFVNESKISDAAMDAIEAYHKGEDKKKNLDKITSLLGGNKEEIEKILKDNDDALDAFELIIDSAIN